MIIQRIEHYQALLTGERRPDTLFCCVNATDRSVALARKTGGKYLDRGLAYYTRLLSILLGDDEVSDRAAHTARKHDAETKLNQIDQYIQTFRQVVFVLTDREMQQYQVAINLILALQVPDYAQCPLVYKPTWL